MRKLKEIAELKTEWTYEETGQKYLVEVQFGLQELKEDAKAKAIRKNKVPYHLTVSLYRYVAKDENLTRRPTTNDLFKADIKFYILDSEGETAVKKITKSSMVMCPS